jgi:galactokinase/mevalonate kinase-like predicted kinase
MKFDLIVITAANEAQARGYRAITAPMRGTLAPEIIVVPDPGGRRVGSLGSTVEVLRKIGGIKSRRVLVCHSGGDSKRLISYAAVGKAFVPVPDGKGGFISLFERIVGNMRSLPLPESGMLVVCGDVAPEFDFKRCSFSGSGVTGVAYYGPVDEGSRHGVYVPEKAGGICRRVAAFLQKPSPATAKAARAVSRGRVAVDTGIMWIDPSTARKMLKAGWKNGDLYDEFARELVSGFAPFKVNIVPECSFFHVGSTRELLERIGGGREWVEACGVPRGEMKLAGRNVVTFVPREYGKVELAEGECLTCLPVDGKWKALRYRVEDDFKTDGKWEALKMGELMKKVDCAKLLALRARRAERVEIELPLRIDLAGGWSDTPPICNDLGGKVFNMAVSLEGIKPVKVSVCRIPVREVRVDSADLGRSGVLKSLAEIRAPKDPSDWCALVKSALTVTGFDFSSGGLDITISANVPKGSGMGTSSILGAALLTALERIAGRGDDWRRISDLTLALEKEMRTGGGWQDQVGGMLAGAKLVSTRRGEEQKIEVKRMGAAAEKAFAAFLEERALLYFTGRKRMARNVLRGVLDFYRENPDDLAREIVLRLKTDAERSFRAVRDGDWDAFCSALNDYWLSKKALDSGSTNPLVELIIARMAPWISAVSLCGAGGGGFMFVIARSKAAKQKIRTSLESHPPIRTGRFYDFRIVQ